MAERAITGFHQDEEEHWVADLACGHTQHLRHKPPFQEREWVTTSEGRASRLGHALDCLFCNMPGLPEDVERYKQTRVFDEDIVPTALLHDHKTKAGTWGRIVVSEGRLLYTVGDESWTLRPGVDGIIEPGVAHKVTPQGAVRFHVEFLKNS
jgi:tellurite resistance-related uncharacterized protein